MDDYIIIAISIFLLIVLAAVVAWRLQGQKAEKITNKISISKPTPDHDSQPYNKNTYAVLFSVGIAFFAIIFWPLYWPNK
jgi:hypothetical protein